MRTSGYLISAFIICLTLSKGYSQTVVINPDSTKKNFAPTGIRLGTDLISVVRNFTKDDFTELNFSVDVDFNRYFFVAEYGILDQSFMADDGTATYNVDGSFFRFGPEVNFLKKDPERGTKLENYPC